MESAFHGHNEVKSSLNQAWRHCQELFSASTPAAAWDSFNKAVDALPMWALIAIGALVAVFVFGGQYIVAPLAAIVFLLVTHATVKRAVVAGLREYHSSDETISRAPPSDYPNQ